MSKVYGAPGKALIAGGYLVLDPSYNSYVTALSSRMHAHCEPIEMTSSLSYLHVSSPQFGGEWTFSIRENVATESQNRRNPFLEAAVKTVLNYVQPEPFALKITLFSDPGYHTQENTLIKTSTNGARSFLNHSKPIEQVAKTGMGLSAGLVSVVTAALLCQLTGKLMSSLQNTIHNVAQIAHCEAQKKIGSGFDVAAAVYGSIIYRRFRPETIEHLLGKELTPELCAELRKVVDSEWHFNHSQCALPPRIRLLMGDVNGGSETPKLVSKVLEWRKRDKDSGVLYSALDSANESLIEALLELRKKYTEDPEKYSLDFESLVDPLKKSLNSIRTGLQQLTERSGADVEPAEQTLLLDECSKLPGCLGGIVPGAGGYDAICLLVDEEKLEELKKAATGPAFGNVTWLDLSEEAEGLVEEPADDYEGLL